MSITTVLVSGQLYNPDGSPAAYADIRFTLAGLGVVGLSLLVPRFAVAQCDASGAFALQVVPNPPGTRYDVRAGWAGALLFSVRAVVPNNACQLTQIMDALPYPAIDASQQALLDLQAAQAEIEADRLSAAASAAAALAAVDAPGRAGPQGIQGAVGPTGPAGPQGVQGEAGPTGADSTIPGPAGPQGLPGQTGLAGADSTVPGPAGPAGAAGTVGPVGPQGVAGPAGADGAALIDDAATAPGTSWSSQKISSLPGVNFDKASPGAIGSTTPGVVNATRLPLTGGTVVADAPPIDGAQTWNNAAVVFTGYKLNITSTASAAASLLMDLQLAGASKFRVKKSGEAVAQAGFWVSDQRCGIAYQGGMDGVEFWGGGLAIATTMNNGISLSTPSAFMWHSGVLGSSLPDLYLRRDAANTLAQRNGANAQTYRLYNTYTDASNYERAALTWVANVAYLRAENAGIGSARLMIPVTGAATVAALPAAATAGIGARAFVTDATATTFLSAVAGGGANKVPVVSDGAAWLIG